MSAGQRLSVSDEDGDITLSGDVVDGIEAVRQSVRARCLMFSGEWFLDPTDGVPYIDQVLIKKPDTSLVASVFRARIEATPGVRVVTSIRCDLDRLTRSASITFAATTDLGELADAFSVGGRTE